MDIQPQGLVLSGGPNSYMNKMRPNVMKKYLI